MVSQKRNSSFELIKILAIVCIIICHSIPTERVEYHYATSDLWLFIIILFRQMGSIGNAIFLVASTWFLVDNDKVNFPKIMQMIADNQLISLLFLGALWFLYDISLKTAVKQVFPFLFSTLWYITCYVLYYCLHGIINRGLKGIRVNPKLLVVIIVVLTLIAFVLGGLYFNELLIFLMIHSFTWFIKQILSKQSDKDIKKFGLYSLLLGVSGWLIGAVVFNCVGVRFSFIGEKLSYWNRFYNPFILAIAYGLMLIASQIHIYSEKINKISGLSLFIYMITGNQLLRFYTDNNLYDLVTDKCGASTSLCAVFVVVYAVIKLLFGIGLSVIYMCSLGKLIKYLTVKECSYISDKILQKFPNLS